MAAMIDIDAGHLSTRLVLEAPETVADGQGGVATVFVEQARLWARVEPRGFAEENRGPGPVSTVTHHVTVRAGRALSPGQRFVAGARVLLIEALRDPDETGRFTLALCRERVG